MRTLLRVCLAGLLVPAPAVIAANHVSVITIDGAIGPATAGYISRATTVAAESKSECLVVQLDTPGGLLESTKQIVQTIYASAVPVVVYVAPAGANAASAGCFITLAADVAAMAPNTSIGAAHPVQLGGGGSGGAQTPPDETMTKKLENYAATYIEAIAAKRGRNVEWAKSSVRESAAITAERALETNVIEIIANDLPELLRKLDGREIRGNALHTAEAELRPIPMLTRERVFQMLWRPEVMFVLMLIAMYGIIGELSSPGAILPGVVGAIALILALYMSAALPVNIAGMALIGLAVALFITDAFAATHGVLTAGAIVSFFLGALMLFDSSSSAFRLSLGMIIPATAVTALFFTLIVGAGLRAQRLPVKAGRETLVGRTAEALTDIDADAGRVFVEGEDWRAASSVPIAKGAPVEITAVKGLLLTVKPKTEGGKS